MAFKRNDIKRIANAFEVDQKNVQDYLYMSLSYLRKNNLNTYTLARAVSILIDKLQNVKKNNSHENFPDFGMKHIAIKRYRQEIIELYYQTIGKSNGWGWIAKELQIQHNVKISRQTIKTYVTRYLEWKLVWQT